MSVWIARDKSGELWGYEDKPMRGEKTFDGVSCVLSMPDELYPEVTWENSPKELVVKREKVYPRPIIPRVSYRLDRTDSPNEYKGNSPW